MGEVIDLPKEFINLRIRCQILKTIASIGPCTSLDVEHKLPHLSAQQVQKGIGKLLEADEIAKCGQAERVGKNGRPRYFYEVIDREGWQPKKTGKKKGRKTYKQSLQSTKQYQGPILHVIRYRDRKIRLLDRLKEKVQGADYDLIIGMINDYKLF